MSSGRGHVIKPKSEVPRLVVFTFALAGLAAAITLAWLFAPDFVRSLIEKEAVNHNSTWLTREWTQTDRSNEDVLTLIAILEDNKINTAYLQTNSWHGQTGEYVTLPYSQNFIQRFRKNTAQIKLYIWMEITPERLFDPLSHQQLVEVAHQTIQEWGLDGVHLQARSVPDNSQDFVDLLRDLRKAVGNDVPISITVPPDRTPADPDVPSSPTVAENLTWSQDYKRRVALNVDEIVLMGHASGLTTAQDYENWLAYQVAVYAEMLEELAIEITYLVALPTYEAELGHDPLVENVTTALKGIEMGVKRAREAGDRVDGVGLYPWEQTDLLELDAYWNNWASSRG